MKNLAKLFVYFCTLWTLSFYTLEAIASNQYVLPVPIPAEDADQVIKFNELKKHDLSELSLLEAQQLSMLTLILISQENYKIIKLDAGIELISDINNKYDDPLIQVVYGGGISQKSRKAAADSNIGDSMLFFRQATRQMDEAVVTNPNNLAARFQRGIIDINFPKFLGRYELAQADFKYVLEKLEGINTSDSDEILWIKHSINVVKEFAQND